MKYQNYKIVNGRKQKYSWKELVNLMQSLLKFNPYFRKSSYECTKLPVFDKVRDPLRDRLI